MTPCNRADTRRGAVGSFGAVLTFFLGAGVLVVVCRFSGLGPMLMVDRPTSLELLDPKKWGEGYLRSFLFFSMFARRWRSYSLSSMGSGLTMARDPLVTIEGLSSRGRGGGGVTGKVASRR